MTGPITTFLTWRRVRDTPPPAGQKVLVSATGGGMFLGTYEASDTAWWRADRNSGFNVLPSDEWAVVQPPERQP